MRDSRSLGRLVSKPPSPAMVVALLALFLSLAGNGLALQGRHTVDGNDLQRGAVHGYAIHKDAVSTAKIADGAVHDSQLANIIVVSNTVSVPTSNQDQTGAFCPDGTTRISGGVASETFGTPISGSRPDGTKAWSGWLRNDSGSPVDLTVYVLCLK
jgi:hypothetical protein